MQEQRNESARKRRDRHWSELLQELRVVQTGVQLLAGFLLTIPFQMRFSELSHAQRYLYLTAICLAALSAGLLMAPVSLHRILFRRRRRGPLVVWSDRLARLGLVTLALTMTAAGMLIFSVVLGWSEAIVFGAVAVAFFLVVWLAIPLMIARGAPREMPEDAPEEA